MRLSSIVFLLTICSAWAANAQTGVLDEYILRALREHPGLQAEQYLLQKQLATQAEAGKLAYPTVSAGGTYTLAAGGRSIDLPIGDLLNPVYRTLNEITMTPAFPQLDNVKEQFLPNNFYDLRVRIQQPILNADIRLKREVEQDRTELQSLSLRIKQRDIIRDVKIAYFQYLQATEALEIYEQAAGMLRESYRVTESLFRNGKANRTALLRIEGEEAMLRAQVAEARQQQKNAAAVFNTLLRLREDTPIQIDERFAEEPSQAMAPSTDSREELAQLDVLHDIQEKVLARENRFRRPQLGAQLDLGSQNFNFGWGGYALLGISVDMPLWDGGRHNKRQQQAQLDLQATAARKEEALMNISLQQSVSAGNLLAAREVYSNYAPQLTGALRVYTDTERAYREGMVSYIELLDARTQLTRLEIQASISRSRIWQRQAELERAQANYPLSDQ